ncbi:MAG: hypothetical protein O9256_02205 [Rhizobiaceae bacterium]|jgi:hypothetical protein|nr:hypothetical protein [Rhizobiaceae bacterium]
MPASRLLLFSFATAAVIAVLGIWKLGARSPEMVEIKNACDTFVSEVSPTRTPALRQNGQRIELILSFTPAKVEEANRLIKAVAGGTSKLRVAASGMDLTALRVEPGLLVLQVQGIEQAKSILRQLCFEEPEISKLSFSRAQ